MLNLILQGLLQIVVKMRYLQISANRIAELHGFFENVITELLQNLLLEKELILGLKVR